MNLLEGKLLAEGQRIGIVAGRFNEFITSKLLGGALDAFKRHGGDEANIDLAWVPGAFEIPLVAKKMAETKKYDAVVCLGAVIRGATPHFDMVANEATKGIANVGLQTGTPIIFGVLTTDTIEQAVERPVTMEERAKEISSVIRNNYGRYDNVPVKVKAELFQFSVDDFEADMKLHSLVLKELNVKMYSSELYDDYMSIADKTDKKPVEEQNVNYYNNEKRWNRSR